MIEGPPEWTRDAACAPRILAGDDPWHPDSELPRRVQEAMYERARSVCIGCVVQTSCCRLGLELLNRDSVDGMYGGATPDQLRSLARAIARSPRKVARHGSRSGYVRGCRCRPCRGANATYEAGRRRGKAA